MKYQLTIAQHCFWPIAKRSKIPIAALKRILPVLIHYVFFHCGQKFTQKALGLPTTFIAGSHDPDIFIP